MHFEFLEKRRKENFIKNFQKLKLESERVLTSIRVTTDSTKKIPLGIPEVKQFEGQTGASCFVWNFLNSISSLCKDSKPVLLSPEFQFFITKKKAEEGIDLMSEHTIILERISLMQKKNLKLKDAEIIIKEITVILNQLIDYLNKFSKQLSKLNSEMIQKPACSTSNSEYRTAKKVGVHIVLISLFLIILTFIGFLLITPKTVVAGINTATTTPQSISVKAKTFEQNVGKILTRDPVFMEKLKKQDLKAGNCARFLRLSYEFLLNNPDAAAILGFGENAWDLQNSIISHYGAIKYPGSQDFFIQGNDTEKKVTFKEGYWINNSFSDMSSLRPGDIVGIYWYEEKPDGSKRESAYQKTADDAKVYYTHVGIYLDGMIAHEFDTDYNYYLDPIEKFNACSNMTKSNGDVVSRCYFIRSVITPCREEKYCFSEYVLEHSRIDALIDKISKIFEHS